MATRTACARGVSSRRSGTMIDSRERRVSQISPRFLSGQRNCISGSCGTGFRLSRNTISTAGFVVTVRISLASQLVLRLIRPEGDTLSGVGQMSLNVNHCHRKQEALFRREKTISIVALPAVVFYSVHVVERAGTDKPSLLLWLCLQLFHPLAICTL